MLLALHDGRVGAGTMCGKRSRHASGSAADDDHVEACVDTDATLQPPRVRRAVKHVAIPWRTPFGGPSASKIRYPPTAPRCQGRSQLSGQIATTRLWQATLAPTHAGTATRKRPRPRPPGWRRIAARLGLGYCLAAAGNPDPAWDWTQWLLTCAPTVRGQNRPARGGGVSSLPARAAPRPPRITSSTCSLGNGRRAHHTRRLNARRLEEAPAPRPLANKEVVRS